MKRLKASAPCHKPSQRVASRETLALILVLSVLVRCATGCSLKQRWSSQKFLDRSLLAPALHPADNELLTDAAATTNASELPNATAQAMWLRGSAASAAAMVPAHEYALTGSSALVQRLSLHGSTSIDAGASSLRVELIKGASVRKWSDVVVYITTYDSDQHMGYLKCWPSRILNKSNLLSRADVIVYKTGKITYELKQDLTKFPNMVVKLVHAGANPGYEVGAIKALSDGFENGFFKGYEWMIRLNPDVIVWSDSFLDSAMRETSTWGVFANCCEASCHQVFENCCELPNIKIHTDFFAVRPPVIEPTAFSDWTLDTNAEEQATTVFGNIAAEHHAAWLALSNRDTACRLRGGGVWHQNSICEDVFARPPWLDENAHDEDKEEMLKEMKTEEVEDAEGAEGLKERRLVTSSVNEEVNPAPLPELSRISLQGRDPFAEDGSVENENAEEGDDHE